MKKKIEKVKGRGYRNEKTKNDKKNTERYRLSAALPPPSL